MPSAPRQGRKGGKVLTSPVVAAANGSGTPSTISPWTLSPGGVFDSTPSDSVNNNVLEFNLEALLSSKHLRPITTGQAAPLSVGADASVLKFDLDAIEQVGQGEVIGAKKNIRTNSHKPEASLDSVETKLRGVFESQGILPHRLEEMVDPIGLAELQNHDVVFMWDYQAALRLSVALSTSIEKAKVMVVVPRYFEVAIMAKNLSHIRNVRGGPAGTVGELCGQSIHGLAGCKLWVCSVETALVFLHTHKSLAPFTHVVMPGLPFLNPTSAYFLWAVREWVFCASARRDAEAPPLHLVLRVVENDCERAQQFFSGLRTIACPFTHEDGVAPKDGRVVEFTYDEANALAQMDVLEVAVDSTGKYPGPHYKLVEHTVKLAVSIVCRILDCASLPQSIYILTADSHDMAEALRSRKLYNTTVFTGQFALEEAVFSSTSHQHCIFITSSVEHFLNADVDHVNFVLDMGTTRRPSLQNKSEGFMLAHSSEWAAHSEIQQHKSVFGALCPCGYIALYPPAAEAVFLENNTSRPALFDIESSILQCSRAGLPLIPPLFILGPANSDALEQALSNLAEKSLIINPMDIRLTLLGEMVARLPLELDLAHFVATGCALGLGESVVALAAVAALPFCIAVGNSAQELEVWRQEVMKSRRAYAGAEVACQSDVIADTLVYLAWCTLKAEGKPTQDLVEQIQVQEWRLERVKVLVEYLLSQLSDYIFLDALNSAQSLDIVVQCIKSNTRTLVFLEAVSLARRVCFVRDTAKLNPNDRTAAFTFVRTSKKAALHLSSVTGIPWQIGEAVVPIDLHNCSSTFVWCSRLSALSTTHFFAMLLLLYPRVEYSSPVEVTGKGRVVYFGITCNRQMKRFRVSITEAAMILDFREKWNTALDYLLALRMSHRPISRRRFHLALKEKDRTFDLGKFHAGLQRELLNIVTELGVTEHQGSFVTLDVHCLAHKPLQLSVSENAEASDVRLARRFRSGELWSVSPSSTTDTPSLMVSTPANFIFPSSLQCEPLFENDDDEIEFITDSYFLNHGPIIDYD